MSMSAMPKIDTLSVGDEVKLAGLFMGLSKEPIQAILVEKSEGEALFEMTMFGVSLGTLFAIRRDGRWRWEV